MIIFDIPEPDSSLAWLRWFAFLVMLIGVSATPARSAQVSLGWDANNDVAGYRVYYGAQSGTYDRSQEAGTATNVTIEGLSPGPYYFVVVAYNQFGIESSPSAEVSTMLALPAAQIALTSPSNGEQMNGPRPITLTADVTSESASPISLVEFFADGQKIGETSAEPYTVTWENAQPGNHSFYAKAWTEGGGSTNSQGVNVSMVALRTSALEFRADGGGAEFVVEAAPGSTNEVYASSDLIHWTLITTVVNSTGLVRITDPDAATASRRFYRIKAR